MSEPKKYLEYPMVIDWLQWSDEFKEELGKPNMPQVTLTLIAEMKAENTKLQAALDLAREVLKAEWPGLYGKTVNELNKEYLSKIEELLK